MNIFDSMSSVWWDDSGPLKTLHHINPVRMDWISSVVSLRGKYVLDVGCGGGILSESLAKAGASVVGIDKSAELIDVAKLHASANSLSIDYQNFDISEFSKTHEGSFDCITCLEVVEHVASPSIFIGHCSKLLKKGGYLFISTINRTAKSYFLAIFLSEYILKILPMGTHDWSCFVKPSELSGWLENEGFLILDIKGMRYNPITERASLFSNVDVNYFMVAQK